MVCANENVVAPGNIAAWENVGLTSIIAVAEATAAANSFPLLMKDALKQPLFSLLLFSDCHKFPSNNAVVPLAELRCGLVGTLYGLSDCK